MTYIPFLVFLLLAAAVIFAEAQWLTRRGWTTSGRAWLFVLATDLIGFGVGGFVSFAIVGVMIMMTFGPSGRGGNSSGASYVVLTGLALLFPPIILFFVKRIFLLFFSMRSGKAAWLYSLVTALIVSVIVALPPPLLYYLLSFVA
ncbi:MAG TPA: hypothetical protein VGI80_09400 [Pyrinomonadaceae bacterium]|jgi:hypothetical protein